MEPVIQIKNLQNLIYDEQRRGTGRAWSQLFR